MPINLEIEQKGLRSTTKRMTTNTNQSNYEQNELVENQYDDRPVLHRDPTNEDLANSLNYNNNCEEDAYTCENYYSLPVEERNLLWNAAREHKLEAIRRMTSGSGLEECTFQPKLITNRCTRRTQKSQHRCDYSVLASNSVQKYVSRMYKARENKLRAQEEQDKKPGSGKIWTNKRTIPREPKFRVASERKERSNHRSSASLSKMISQHNLSIQNLNLNDDLNYEEEYCNVQEYVQTNRNKLLGRRATK